MAGADVLDDVSRETLGKLEALEALVQKWTSRINLISRESLPDLKTRHIADSVLVSRAIDGSPAGWADMGSGGGFPGLVISLLRPETEVVLIESDRRKAEFLRTARRELDLNLTVIPSRIEAATPAEANVVSARALARLDLLLTYSRRHAAPEATCVFPKGETWREEHEEAQINWSYDLSLLDGLPGTGGKILKLTNVRPRHD